MYLAQIVLLLAAAAALLLPTSPALRIPLGLAAALWFPGTALLAMLGTPRSHDRDWLLGPAFSPLLLGGAWYVAWRWGLDPSVITRALVLASGLAVVFYRAAEGGERAPSATSRGGWVAGVIAAGVIAFILWLSPYQRENSDSWFHIAVFHELLRTGLPLEDPYFAHMPLQYFWFFHAILAGAYALTGALPHDVMGLLNVAAALLCLPLAVRIARALGLSDTAGVWAGVLLMLGLGGLFWLFLPIKLVTAFTGEVTGADELRRIFDFSPLTRSSSSRFVQFFGSKSFFPQKFLVGTAASWSFLLTLVAVDAALRWMRSPRPWLWLRVVAAGAGTTTMHALLGGASTAALGLGALAALVMAPGTRGRAFGLGVATAIGLALPVPYLLSLADAASGTSPIGFIPGVWLTIPFTLGGVLLLGFFAFRAFYRRGSALDWVYLGWAAGCFLYLLFGQVPGSNQYDKPPLVAYVPLALAAGFGVPIIWSRLQRRGVRILLVLALTFFLVPENLFRLSSYITESRPPEYTSGERALWNWAREKTPREAILVDSNDRVDFLVRIPRRQFWGHEGYARTWNYPVDFVNERRAVRDALYAEEPLPDDVRAVLAAEPDPLYVVFRPGQEDARSYRLTGGGFRQVYHVEGYSVLEWVGR